MADLAFDLAPTEDDRLNQAEALVRAYCGWHIAPERTGQRFALGESATFVLLPSLHVTAVAVTDADEVEVASDTYTWTEAGVVKPYGLWWPAGTTITYTHGYSDIPLDVTAIVQSVAQRAVDNPSSIVRSQAGPFGVTYSQSGFNQSIPLSLLEAEAAVLDRYKIPARP